MTSQFGELNLLIPIVNRRVRARRDAHDQRILLRSQSKFGKREIDADSRVQKKSGANQKKQQKQKDKIHQRDNKDQEWIELYGSGEFHRCSPAALELGSNSIMDEFG